MTYPSLEQFFKQHLRFRQHWNKKQIRMEDAVWQTLDSDTFLDGIEYAKGSEFKIFETTNFGFIVFGPESKTPSGDIPGKRIIKY